jgi:hypothetical protein
MARDESPKPGTTILTPETIDRFAALLEGQQKQIDLLTKIFEGQKTQQAVPPGLSPDNAAQIQAILDGLRPKAPPDFEKRLACKSPDDDGTGATFDAIVAPSSTFPQGRCVRLENYKHPADLDARVSALGLPTRKDDAGRYTEATTKQWMYVTFWQADLRRFVGKPLPAHIIVKAEPALAPASP